MQKGQIHDTESEGPYSEHKYMKNKFVRVSAQNKMVILASVSSKLTKTFRQNAYRYLPWKTFAQVFCQSSPAPISTALVRYPLTPSNILGRSRKHTHMAVSLFGYVQVKFWRYQYLFLRYLKEKFSAINYVNRQTLYFWFRKGSLINSGTRDKTRFQKQLPRVFEQLICITCYRLLRAVLTM